MVDNHWKYNEMIVRLAYKGRMMISVEDAIELMEYFYIKAMVHGIRHKSEGRIGEN
jgi:hypothetical protein